MILPRAVVTVALRGPGKILLLASACGWIVLAWLTSDDRPVHAATLGHGNRDAGHLLWLWSAMILAMAPPLLLREIARLWRTSLVRLRHLTLGCFLCGYVGVWLLVGVVLTMISGWAIGNSARIAFVCVMVAIWHCSPARQRCLNACHRVPTVRVFGAAAHWDAWRYGISTGWYCGGACGPIMVLALFAPDSHLGAMAAVAVVATFERHAPARRPRWRVPLVSGRSPEWPEMPIVVDRSACAS
jgi:predicted metal-binding membrane protein